MPPAFSVLTGRGSSWCRGRTSSVCRRCRWYYPMSRSRIPAKAAIAAAEKMPELGHRCRLEDAGAWRDVEAARPRQCGEEARARQR
uniref:Uncharacterized protein n=1 Tax=Oryza glumipatula TaxID=40148 RepID=A0A0E0AS81_9ORYZ